MNRQSGRFGGLHMKLSTRPSGWYASHLARFLLTLKSLCVFARIFCQNMEEASENRPVNVARMTWAVEQSPAHPQ